MRGVGKGGIERLVVIVIIIIIISSFPPASLGFQEALVRQVRDLEELLGSSEFAWVRYLRACTHSFPFPHFLSPPQPLPPFTFSPLLDPSMFAYRAVGRRGQERWRFSRRVLPDLLPAVSELVPHQSSASSPRTSFIPL